MRLFAEDSSWFKKWKIAELVSGQDQQRQRLTVASVRSLSATEALVHFGEVQDRNQSEALRGAFVEVPSDYFISLKGEGIYLSEIQDFKVQDALTGGALGQLREFSSNGPQDLLGIHLEGRRYWLPFVPEFVLKIDFESRILHVFVPDGLLDIAELLPT